MTEPIRSEINFGTFRFGIEFASDDPSDGVIVTISQPSVTCAVKIDRRTLTDMAMEMIRWRNAIVNKMRAKNQTVGGQS